MRTRPAMFMLLLLPLVLALGTACSAEESDTLRKPSVERATQELTGGTWESEDETGDALNFRPNGTGQGYIAESDFTAEINWEMTAENGDLVLTWGYIETRPEDEKVWVIEIDGDHMRIWPLSGSRVLLDPEEDDPFVLQRFE